MNNLLLKVSPIIVRIGTFEIRWYAVCILIGAIICYLTCQWVMKREGYAKDIFESVFFIAFPAGIIGARIWWCLSDAGSPWKEGNFWGVITEIRNGGLAIQGGVILGALAGIGYMLWKHRNVNIFFAMDAIIPNILIAQSIGRWGNFFNQEVYGQCVDYSKLNFLPDFIHKQMQGDIVNGINKGEFVGDGCYIKCASTQAAQPLFLYEGLLNIVGWVLITFVLRLFWKKGRVKGDLAALYLVWYGIVRVCLEPLRNEEFIMNGWGKIPVSVITSIAFIIGGVALMIVLRIIEWQRKKKHPNDKQEDENNIKEETTND